MNVCPKCGAALLETYIGRTSEGKYNIFYWDCGSSTDAYCNDTHESRECLRRQIAALEERLAEEIKLREWTNKIRKEEIKELKERLAACQRELEICQISDDRHWGMVQVADKKLEAWRELKPHLEGWDAYGWKDGKYIPSIEDYFDDQMDKLRDLGEL